MPLDIVYPYRHRGDGSELRYSLRSLANLPHRRIFIVGDCPAWVQNVTHIPVPQTGPTKYANARANIVAACQLEELSEDFVLMNDDFYVLTPQTRIDVAHQGTMSGFLSRFPYRSAYFNLAQSTKDLLRSERIEEPNFYELHVPTVLNKKRLLALLDLFQGEKFMLRTLYHNYYRSGGYRRDDVKKYSDRHDITEIDFLSSSDAFAKLPYFRSHMRRRFREPCYYEVNETVHVQEHQDGEESAVG